MKIRSWIRVGNVDRKLTSRTSGGASDGSSNETGVKADWDILGEPGWCWTTVSSTHEADNLCVLYTVTGIIGGVLGLQRDGCR